MKPSPSARTTGDPATTVYQLDNGLTVLIREDHFAPVAAMQVWVEAGGADEHAAEAGVAHVHEHMLFKGTTTRGVGEIANEIESSGGRINAWTSWNETVYHIILASRYADTGIDVLADAVRHSSFDPAELHKELGVVLEEWKRGQDRPSNRIFEKLFETAFRVHPYRRPVIGTKESIEGLTRAKVLDFYHRFYAPNNMTLIVVGDVDTKRMKSTIEKYFGDFRAHEIDRPARPAEPPQKDLRFSDIRMKVQEAQLALGFHVPGADDPDAPLLDLLAFVLGGGESSRLYRRLVAEDELATSINAFAYTPPDPGLFLVTASLEANDVDRAYATVVDELTRIREGGPTADELSRAVTNLESDFVFRKETVQGQARELGYSLVVHNDPDYDRVYLQRLHAATLEDLQRVAAKYLTRENLNVVTLVPEGAAERLDHDKAELAAAPLDEPVTRTAATAATGTDELSKEALDEAPAGTASPKPRLVTLANGARIIVVEHHDVPVFSVRAAMLGGVLAEKPKTNGISNFVAEMLTRGTEEHSREALARVIESMAGSLGGFSGQNSLGVSGSFLSSDFDEGMDLTLEVLRRPSFDPVEVEKTKRELLLAIKNREDDTAHVAFDLAFKTVYPKHPYGMTTLGETDSVSAIDADRLRHFYRRALDPSHLVIAVVGDVDSDTVVRKLTAGLSDMSPPGDPLDMPGPAAPPYKMREAERATDRQQAHVVVAFPSVDVKDPDRYPLAVLDNILSGQGGRLFYELRDKQSLAYSVTAFFTKGLTPGVFGVYIATDPSNVQRAIDGILLELEKVRTADVSGDELARAQRFLIGSRAIGLQTNSALAEDKTFNELYGLGFMAGNEYPDKILAVTADDVRRVATKYLDPAIRAEVVVGPADQIHLTAGS